MLAANNTFSSASWGMLTVADVNLQRTDSSHYVGTVACPVRVKDVNRTAYAWERCIIQRCRCVAPIAVSYRSSSLPLPLSAPLRVLSLSRLSTLSLSCLSVSSALPSSSPELSRPTAALCCTATSARQRTGCPSNAAWWWWRRRSRWCRRCATHWCPPSNSRCAPSPQPNRGIGRQCSLVG
jgi:hypothetical protein